MSPADTADTTRVKDIVREACIAELFAGTTLSDIVPLATAIARRTAALLVGAASSSNAPRLPYPAMPNRPSRAGYHDQTRRYHPSTDVPEFGSHILDCERCQVEWRSHGEYAVPGASCLNGAK